MKNKKIIKFSHVFLIGIVFYLFVYALVGVIPVGSGAGWDGSVYLDYVLKVARGERVVGDPYRLMRVSGFLPSVFAVHLGLVEEYVVYFQMIINSVLLSAAAALFFKVIYILSRSQLRACVFTGVLFFSWPYLVMPIYYPMLSDHLALVISVVAISAWLGGRDLVLLLVIFVSCWVMPGLFLVPLLLVMMPRSRCMAVVDKSVGGQLNNNKILQFSCFFGLLFLFSYFVFKSFYLSIEEIDSYPNNLNLGISEWRYFTLFLLTLGFVGVAWVCAKVLSLVEFLESISIKRVVISVLILFFGLFSVRFFIDWGSGFHGPPLIYFLVLQASSAPMKPFVAHFIYFGPIFFLAVAFCLNHKNYFINPGSLPLFVIMLVYLPLLLTGSESRQWIAVFPVMVALVSLSQYGSRSLLILVLFSVFLCMPAFHLREGVMVPFREGLKDLGGGGWQWYFGRHGPWMSQKTYTMGLVYIFVFYVVHLLSRRRGTHL